MGALKARNKETGLWEDIPDVKNYYTKDAIDKMIRALSGINLEIVAELPTENIKANTIYLKLQTDSFLDDYYDEYMYSDSQWKLVGNTRLNLSNYYTKDEVEKLIAEALKR